MILHAHLPYVRHPEYDSFLEENWLFEAITETYIPLLTVMRGLVRDGVPFRITFSMTPTLVTMLEDDLLISRYLRHLDRLIELAGREVERTAEDPAFNSLARFYLKEFQRARETLFEIEGGRIVRAFRKLQDSGAIEIMASCATHAYLPLIRNNPRSVRAQVLEGTRNYAAAFGRPPRGFWLPECGYFPGVEEFLAEAGIRYFVLDSHGLLNADPQPRFGVYAPVFCPNGVAAFGRDPESSKQVWSAKEGYPGDYDYREFYRDIGFDLNIDYIRPYIHPGDIRINTGIKYYRITGPGDHKEPYAPSRAIEKAAIHAGNFMFNRERQAEYLAGAMNCPPLIVAPYDAELFGHWWFEGPRFLDFLARKIAFDQNTIALTTPSEYLEAFPVHQVCRPAASSWGYNGFNEIWLNGANDWIYRYLHAAAGRMEEMAAGAGRRAAGIKRRALNQAARELMLAQASDWAFIMKAGTTVEYAKRRVENHMARFGFLADGIERGKVDRRKLEALEEMDAIFPDLDYRLYA